MFGMGLQVAVIDPSTRSPINKFTLLPRDSSNTFLAKRVDPLDFWAVGYTEGNSPKVIISQGEGNIDDTVKFEYSVPEDISEGTSFTVVVVYRGGAVTSPLQSIICQSKGKRLPYLRVSEYDENQVYDLNFNIIRKKFRNTFLEETFHVERDPALAGMYTAPDGVLKIVGYPGFVVYAPQQRDAEKIFEMYGETLHGFPLEISQTLATGRTLGNTLYLTLFERRTCILL